SVYRNGYVTRLGADMISLRTIMAAIDDGSYANHQNFVKDGVTITSSLPTLNDGLKDYERVKTFISMMRNVNDYLDRMVSITRLVDNPIVIPHNMNSQQANLYLNQQVDAELFEYCKETKE